MDIELKWGS